MIFRPEGFVPSGFFMCREDEMQYVAHRGAHPLARRGGNMNLSSSIAQSRRKSVQEKS